jgi:hypothetical protein
MSRIWSSLALMGTGATLVCCVIPASLVLLGFGASMAGLVSVFPQITWFSEHKELTFLAAGLLLALAIWARLRPSAQTCPADPQLAKICMRSRAVSKVMLVAAGVLYLVSVGFVYLLPLLAS